MSWAIVGCVLFGALLHASWNALVKSGHDKALDTVLINTAGALLGVVLLALVGLPARESWPWIAASAAIHLFYYVTLVGAYQHGDLGFAYPIMRGSAPLLVAIASGSLLGERLSPASWLGVCAICGGVLLIGLGRSRSTPPQGKALAFALCNAVIIASYTIVDGFGVRAARDALPYVAALFLVDGLPFLAWVGWRRRREIVAHLGYMRRRAPLAAVGACASAGSYGIALWAMTKAPVATVAALRETSVLFAALIGVAFLDERLRLQRVVGTGAVVAGVMALRLG